MEKNSEKTPSKDDNQIKVGANTRVRSTISYAFMLLRDRQQKEINISAIGGAIEHLLNIVEIVKADIPDLYQTNKISTVSYQTVDNGGKVIQERLYPKMEVILATEEPTIKGEGYQGKVEEEKRKAILEFMNKKRDENETRRGGRGFGRGDRGGRGGRGRGYGDREGGYENRGERRQEGGYENRGERRFDNRDNREEGGLESRGRGGRGYESRGGRGGYENRGGRGGFESRGGRGGFESRGGRGGYESRGGRGGYESRGGRGGFESRGGRGGFESRGGRGGFESRGGRDFENRGGRGGFESRGRGGQRRGSDF
jgi:hypothetical protein